MIVTLIALLRLMCCCVAVLLCYCSVVRSGVKQVKVESAAEQQDELVPFESTVEDFSEMGTFHFVIDYG